MSRQLAKFAPALLAASRTSSCLPTLGIGAIQAVAGSLYQGTPSSLTRGFHFSPLLSKETSPDVDKVTLTLLHEPPRKFRPIHDKELWHEAWLYEDKFGTETDPIVVPSLEKERIIGVTDPEDELLLVWGVLKANQPPRQFVEGGEYYILKEVPQIAKVGDVMEQLEAANAAQGSLEH